VATAKSRESCLAAVGAAGRRLILQAVRLANSWPIAGRPAACSPTGALWTLWACTGLQQGGAAYWVQSHDLSEENQIRS